MISRHVHHPVTNRLALIVGIGAFVIVVYWISFASMWNLWQTSDHRHGLLVFPISAYLVWQLRHHVGDIPLKIDPRGLLLIMPLAAVWIVARLAGVQVIEHIVVLAMIPAAIFAMAGQELTHKLLFPLLFLLLATPLGDSLVPYLMVITADLATGLLELTGIPVLRDGQYLSLSGGDFVVADVCSGLHYLVTGTMISLLFGYLTFESIVKRAVFVAITGVTLVVTNGIRAYIVMAVASGTDMQYLGGRDHIYFGWLLFGIVMVLVMWIGARFADEQSDSNEAGSTTIVARASHTALPIIAALGLVMLAITIKPLQADFGETGTMVAVAAALLILILLLARQRNGSTTEVPVASAVATKIGIANALVGIATIAILILAPRFVAGVEDAADGGAINIDLESMISCEKSGPWNQSWRPSFETPGVEEALAFDCDGQPINVFVARYASVLQGTEIISSSHYPVPPGWDRFSSTSEHSISDADGVVQKIVEVVVSGSSNKAIIWYWYDIDGRVSIDPVHTKVLQVMALVQRRPAGGQVVVIETPIDGSQEIARQSLERVANFLMVRRPASEKNRDPT